jgi:hypothetical protein
MKVKRTIKIVVLIIFSLSIPTASSGQQAKLVQSAKQSSATATRKADKGPIKSPMGETFSITPSLESPTNFSVIISDGEEQVISGEFSVEKLRIILEIMNEAKTFAFSEEAVGKGEALTMRFSNDQVRGFVVDVSKLENQSHFYVTLKTQGGLITVDAGTIRRNEKKAEGFFFDILSRVESQVPALANQSPK